MPVAVSLNFYFGIETNAHHRCRFLNNCIFPFKNTVFLIHVSQESPLPGFFEYKGPLNSEIGRCKCKCFVVSISICDFYRKNECSDHTMKLI